MTCNAFYRSDDSIVLLKFGITFYDAVYHQVAFLDGIINSFDVGTPYVTHDQVAQIHKGEAVLTPDEAAAWRNGGGGNVYNIDARGADAGAVRRIEQTLMTLAGPGRIEARVADAQRRGRL